MRVDRTVGRHVSFRGHFFPLAVFSFLFLKTFFCRAGREARARSYVSLSSLFLIPPPPLPTWSYSFWQSPLSAPDISLSDFLVQIFLLTEFHKIVLIYFLSRFLLPLFIFLGRGFFPHFSPDSQRVRRCAPSALIFFLTHPGLSRSRTGIRIF